jgi:hypothetical protein
MADLSSASSRYSSKTLQRWFWILLVLNSAFIIWSRNYLSPLDTGDIIKFETAKHLPVAESLISEWTTGDSTKLDKAGQAINIDYLFIALYVIGLSIACVYLSNLTGHEILKKSGRFLPFLLVAAGICDIVENVAMWYSMNGHLTQWNVTVTYDMAVTKFSIIILTLLFLLVCLIFYLLRILTRESETSTSFHAAISQK